MVDEMSAERESKMLNQEILAGSKAFSKSAKKARGGLEPGVYDVDTVVRVKGQVKIGDDYEKTSTSSILNQEFLMLVLHHAGVTRHAAVSVMKKIADEYLQDWKGSKEDKKAAKAARKEMVEKFDPDGKIEGVLDAFKQAVPKISCKGAVKWEGEVEAINSIPVTEIEIAEISEAKVA